MSREPQIRPFMFGADDRKLFGILHRAAINCSMKPAVLVCGPFGREAIRTQRLQRVFADRLAREGYAAMRFDYYGSGDSHGRDTDVDLDGWVADIVGADKTLRVQTGCDRAIWVGFRLGATAMLEAAARTDNLPPRLILWDPVVDGKRYLRELRRRHEESAANTFSLRRQALLDDVTGFSADQILGYAAPPNFVRQVSGLSLEFWSAIQTRDVVCILVDPESPDARVLSEIAMRLPTTLRVLQLAHDIDWLSSAAQNVTLVSAPALMALLRAVQEAT